ncbi:MAG: PepSY domain-containing protein [Firmicutes bacterium]|nr:PepSY domain-containing protein [Bacillota bacterium]
MKRKNYKAITALMIGTFLTAGTIAACASQSEAAPTQAITSSQELMASGAKSASVPVETTARTTDGGSASKAAPAPASAADIPSQPASAADISSQPASAKDIGEAAAKQIALEHAGVAEADASHLWVSRDYDDGRLEYEVEFFSGSKEYDYDIDAADGSILSFDSETEFAGKKTAGSEGISLEQAKKIALAKVPGANDSHIRIEKDRDDGQLLYEGKIVYSGVEYEFEISAADGSVLDWEIDD